jgi:hypothetical protein
MPYRRAAFALTPPSLAIFVVSLVLAVIALLIRYGGVSIPIIKSSNIFEILVIAYLLLTLGVLLRRL